MNKEVSTQNVQSDMSDYWNGDGGKKWVRFQDRIDESLFHFGEKTMMAAHILQGEKVLDVGCGCGDTSFSIARDVGDLGSVHGIDISSVILEQAKSKAGQHSNVYFDCVDAQSHVFRHAHYDLVFSRFGIMFFHDPILAFSNIRTSLLPGGRIVFVCWQSIKDNPWVSLPLRVAAEHVSLPEPPQGDEPGAFSLGEANRIEYILSKSGFSKITIEPFNTMFNVGMTLDDAVTFLTHIGPAGSIVDALDVDERVRSDVAGDLFIALGQHKTVQGIKLGASAWIVTARRSQ